MQIQELMLVNFRNYESLKIKLGPGINIFIGDNGQGKTNILESIYVLSLSKSNRYGLDSDLIKYDTDFLKLQATVKNNDIIKHHEIVINKQRKTLFINNKEIKKVRDYISNFCVISFNPDDLEIIKGSPNNRRNLLNIDLSQLYNSYINYLNEYNVILKMRNDYLKKMNINGNTDERYLQIINTKLIEKATYIYYYRYLFLDHVNAQIGAIYKKISGLDGLSIKFVNSLGFDKYDEKAINKKFNEKFKRNLYQELLQGNTLCGPHRDDFIFNLDGVDMRVFASQGQQRLAIIAFKICELYLFKEIIGSFPVFLLDDIFSEIDIRKRNKIVSFLRKDMQTIITTTDINDINKKLLEKASIYYIKNNSVKRKGGEKNERRKGTK